MVGEVLQFDYNPGGLNNQKLALLGLFTEARKKSAAVKLPRFASLEHSKDRPKTVPLSSVYDIASLCAFAERWHIKVVGTVEEEEISSTASGPKSASWPFFGAGSIHIASTASSGKLDPDDIACDFFRSLTPKAQEEPQFKLLEKQLFGDLGVETVVQMRIEKDWQFYSAVTLKPTAGAEEDYLPSFRGILEKVTGTLGRESRPIYVVCDEAALSDDLEQIRQVALDEYDLKLFWKSSVLGKDFVLNRSALDLSIYDFEMALRGNRFVGLTRSTFSNLVAFQTYAATREEARRNYIYNSPGPRLQERLDNGAFCFPNAAVKALPGSRREREVLRYGLEDEYPVSDRTINMLARISDQV